MLPDASYLYEANYYKHTVSAIRLSDLSVTTTIPIGNYPKGLAVSPNGKYVYVTSTTDDTLSVIGMLGN